MVSVTSSETDLRKLNLCNHLYLHSICFLYNIDVPFFQSRIGPYFTKRIKSSWKNALHSSLPECIGGGTCQKLTNELRHPVILWWNVSVKKRKASPLQFWFFAVYTKKSRSASAPRFRSLAWSLSGRYGSVVGKDGKT